MDHQTYAAPPPAPPAPPAWNGKTNGLSIASLALALLVLAVLIAVAVAVVNDIADGPDRDATGAVRGERSVRITDVRAGDCIKHLDAATGTSVDVVPCGSPHTSEIVAVVTLPDGPWPGTSEIETNAQADCEQRFTAYAGRKPDEDAYLIVPAPPQEVDWPTDREVLCIAHQRDGTTTGSLRR